MWLTAVVVSAMVALVAARVATVPGWESQRWVARACVGTAAFAALDLPLSAPAGGSLGALAPLTPWAVRVQLLVAAVTLWLWMRYADAFLRTRRRRLETAVTWAVLAAGIVALVPGAVVAAGYRERAAGGVTLRDPILGPAAGAVAAAVVLAYAALAARFVRAWRAGVPAAGAHAAAFATLVALAAQDALAWEGRLPVSNLADVGAAVPTAAIGILMALRLVREAGAASELRQTLEARVLAGTRALARSREALHRAEKLAAVGQLAAGVAHEVNNPAAAAQANLGYVVDLLERGRPPADALAALHDAQRALDRIGDIVRRLTGAGRLATTTAHTHRVELGPVMRESLRLARVRCPDHVRLELGPGDVAASTDEGLVVQVLVNLVVNGAQAIPLGQLGRVLVSAVQRGDVVAVTVEDDGEGMTPEVLGRIFEPFFTTKPFGVGTGLGLSISKGLLAAVGGTLRLESEPGRGTRAIVELPAAERAAAAAEADPGAASAA